MPLANDRQPDNNVPQLLAGGLQGGIRLKAHHWLAIALVAFSLAACQSPTLQPAVQPLTRAASADADLYPLETGTSWSYRLAQSKNGQPTGRTDTMGSKVVAVTDTAGSRVAKVERTYTNTTLPATQATRTADGVVLARWPEPTPTGGTDSLPLNRGRLGGGQPAGSERFLPLPETARQASSLPTDGELTTSLQILSFPPQAGQSWTGRVWTFAKETLTAQGWEQITVPAGTYKAWHVTHRIAYDDGRSDNLGYWYAPGTGMIKAHEESTLVMGGQATKYSVDGELTASQSPPQAPDKGLSRR
jgi:hypothetical protein